MSRVLHQTVVGTAGQLMECLPCGRYLAAVQSTVAMEVMWYQIWVPKGCLDEEFSVQDTLPRSDCGWHDKVLTDKQCVRKHCLVLIFLNLLPSL